MCPKSKSSHSRRNEKSCGFGKRLLRDQVAVVFDGVFGLRGSNVAPAGLVPDHGQPGACKDEPDLFTKGQ